MFIGSIVESVEKLFVAWKRLPLGKYLQCFNTGRRLTNNKKKNRQIALQCALVMSICKRKVRQCMQQSAV